MKDVKEIAQMLFDDVDVNLVEFINLLIYKIVENDAPAYIDEVNEEQVGEAIDTIVDSIIEQIQSDVYSFKLDLVDKLMEKLTKVIE